MNPLLQELRALPVAECIKGLAAHFATQCSLEDPKLPRVEVATTFGIRLEGVVLRVDSTGPGHSGPHVVLSHGSPNQRSAVRVTTLPLAAIVAVTIDNAEWVAPLLTQGSIARTDTEGSPTRLQLRRYLKGELGEAIGKSGFDVPVEVDFDAIPDGPVALLNLRDVCSSIPEVLASISKDSMGMEALKGLSEFKVIHDSGGYLRASQDGGVATISVDLQALLPAAIASVLEDELSRVL